MKKLNLNSQRKEHQKIIDAIKKTTNFKNIPDLQGSLKEVEENLKNAKSLSEFSNIAAATNEIYKMVAREKAIKSWKEDSEVNQTISILDGIKTKTKALQLYGEPYEPSILLEWVMYRALGSVFGRKAIFNGVANDQHTLPLSTAGGKKPDLVVEFSDFILVLEVTLTASQRQYDTETEPVTRHLAEVQKENPKKNVYGFFVALDILPNVIDYFLIHHAFHKHPISNKNILLVPLELNFFIDLYKHMIKSKKSEASIKKYFETFEKTKQKNTCSSCHRAEITLDDFRKECQKNYDQMLKDL